MVKKLTWTVLLLAVLSGAGAAWYNGLLASLYASYPELPPIKSSFPNYDVQVIAHRGHELAAPENTLESFRAALERGVEYLEVDMRVTEDGVPIVFHDATVDRTTDGEGQVMYASFEEIRALDAGSWFGPEFAGARVPTVEEVLNEAQGRACIMADVKGVPNRRLVELLKEFGEQQDDPHCLLIALRVGVDLTLFPLEDASEEKREHMIEIAQRRDSIKKAQYRVFRRYWPEFPYLSPITAKNTIDEVLDTYPSVVALDANPGLVTKEFTQAAHERGIFLLSRITGYEGNYEDGGAYQNLIDKGIDAIFSSDIVDLQEYIVRAKAERSN